MSAVINPGDLSHFDPFGRPFRDHPDAFYAKLVAMSPGFCEPEGIASAYVASHADVSAVLRDPARFSSVKPKGLPGMEKVDFFNGLPVMNYSDDPMHARLRRIVQPAFSPKRAHQMMEATSEILSDLLNKLNGRTEFDVMADLMKPLSAELLLGRFMGVPAEDRPIFLNFLATIPQLEYVRPGGPKPEAYLKAWHQGVDYCASVAAQARKTPSDDLISVLVAANEEDGKLSDDELMAMMVLLFIGGVSTMASAIGSALLNMAKHPELAQRIRQQPDLATKLFEESLRLDPVVLLVMRFATEDVEMGGQTILKGMPVYTIISAACHDPAVFPTPEQLNIDRGNLGEHLGFGRGIHVCIGNSITRAAAPLIINAMAQRFPTLRVADNQRISYDSVPRSRHLASAFLSL